MHTYSTLKREAIIKFLISGNLHALEKIMPQELTRLVAAGCGDHQTAPLIENDLRLFRPTASRRSLPCTWWTTSLPASLVVYVPQ
jgi:hypothetical protein